MKKFNMIDESFICENCGKEVTRLGYTARDHCPFCLYSKHLDINPGDRENTCKGLMRPIGIEKFKNSYKIIYSCDKCHELHKNIMANDDNFDLIISLSKNIIFLPQTELDYPHSDNPAHTILLQQLILEHLVCNMALIISLQVSTQSFQITI